MTKQNRRQFLQRVVSTAAPAALAAAMPPAGAQGANASAPEFQVGAYYFPNYHVDPRNEKRYGHGWTEWELVKAARPRFPGHRQPRVPAWGYVDEANPRVMEKKIDVAANHGIDYWIFDWYWYNDGPFLNRCLEEGYFHATNNQRVKFCCMWANHDWVDIFPAQRGKPHQLLYPGAVTRSTFNRIVDRVVDRYFPHPAHWKVDGCPYFSIYNLGTLVASFGGLDEARRALDYFRARTAYAGFPSLHLNAVVWGRPMLPGEKQPIQPGQLVKKLGFDSVTSYVWIHHVPLPDLQTDYGRVQKGYFDYWQRAEKMFAVPYFPNVSVGWDPSPRTDQDDPYGNFGYPFTNTVSGNTPARFRAALAATRKRLEARPNSPRILNINAWNEWTEGSYLEPDRSYGTGYLDAIRSVFGTS